MDGMGMGGVGDMMDGMGMGGVGDMMKGNKIFIFTYFPFNPGFRIRVDIERILIRP